jgi:hypothetical protein
LSLSAPTFADDPAPPAGFTPPPIPTPSSADTSGPTYVITPGVGGSQLPAPSDHKAVEKAKKADQTRHRSPTKRTPGSARPGRSRTAVAGPQTPLATAAGSSEKVAPALRGFTALVAMLVLYEITAVRRYLLRRPPVR